MRAFSWYLWIPGTLKLDSISSLFIVIIAKMITVRYLYPSPGFFLTKIFHPNVSSRGEICVNTLKKDWKSDLGLKHILLTIKCLLIVPNPESALNEEAGKLLLERYDDYCARWAHV